jgi:hypothetical protein
VRFWAAYALGQLRERRAIAELSRLADSDHTVLSNWWSVRREALDAIMLIRGREGQGHDRAHGANLSGSSCG